MTVFIIPFLLIGLYGWFSAIGFGLSLLRLLPRMTLVKQALRMATPVWGIANVLLVATLLALAVFFRHSAEEVFALVQPELTAGVLLLLIQSSLVIGLFYKNAKTGLRPANIAYVITSFLLPVTLSLAAIRLLSGGQFWQSALGWVLVAAVALGLVALASTFVYYVVGHTPHDRLHMLARWLIIGLSVLIAGGLLLTVTKDTKHLQSATRLLLVAMAGSVVAAQIILALLKRERYMWWYVSVFAICVPLLLALADKQNLLLLRQ